jgi:hypothetical protein
MANNNNLPEYVFGGSGKDWIRFGNVVVNNSKEGWDSMGSVWDWIITFLLIIGGIISLFCGIIFLGIILVGLGIWGCASEKARDWISTIITWGLVAGIVIGIFAILA